LVHYLEESLKAIALFHKDKQYIIESASTDGGEIIIIDEFKLESNKTKEFFGIIRNDFKLTKALILDKANRNLELSSRNIPHIKFMREEGLNVYDLLNYEWLLITKEAVAEVQSRLTPTKTRKSVTGEANA